MSLADQIAERNTEQNPNIETDEFGIPVPTVPSPEYLVARALIISERERKGRPAIYGIHVRDGQLYKGHTELGERRKTLLELTRVKRAPKDWEEVEFWRLLKEYAPKLNRSILQVADGLYWDTNNAELINTKEAHERSKDVRAMHVL